MSDGNYGINLGLEDDDPYSSGDPNRYIGPNSGVGGTIAGGSFTPGLPPGALDLPGGNAIDPNDPGLLRAFNAYRFIQNLRRSQGQQDTPPQDARFPRMPYEGMPPDQLPSLEGHPVRAGIEHGLDALSMLSTVLSNRRRRHLTGIASRTEPITPPPLNTERREEARARFESNRSTDVANQRIAQAEAEFNAKQQAAYQLKRESEMNAILPSITAAAARDPREIAFKQKIDFMNSAQYQMADPETRKRWDAVLGVTPKVGSGAGGRMTPDEVYANQRARLGAGYDFATESGVDPQQEKDLAEAAKEYDYNVNALGMDPDEAHRSAVTRMNEKAALRITLRSGASPRGRMGARPPVGGAGAGTAPAGNSETFQGKTASDQMPLGPRVNARVNNVMSDRAKKIVDMYVGQATRFPDRRDRIRALVMRTDGFDPKDFVVEDPDTGELTPTYLDSDREMQFLENQGK